jgi:histidine triad (HIT) family protein
MSDCLFCKMISKELKVPFVFEDDQVIVIKDKFPKAPTHMLVIPKKHYTNLNDIPESELAITAHMLGVLRKLAKDEGISEKGYRSIFNTNAEGGQSVFHLHLHLLGGKQLGASMVD